MIEDVPQVAPHKAKKDTRRWCGGHKGREHEPEIVLDKYVASLRRFRVEPERAKCAWTLWFVRGDLVNTRPHFSCGHQRRCATCGKVLDFRVLPEQCPDYVEGPKGSVENLRCICGDELAQHRNVSAACTRCRCQRFRWNGEG